MSAKRMQGLAEEAPIVRQAGCGGADCPGGEAYPRGMPGAERGLEVVRTDPPDPRSLTNPAIQHDREEALRNRLDPRKRRNRKKGPEDELLTEDVDPPTGEELRNLVGAIPRMREPGPTQEEMALLREKVKRHERIEEILKHSRGGNRPPTV